MLKNNFFLIILITLLFTACGTGGSSSNNGSPSDENATPRISNNSDDEVKDDSSNVELADLNGLITFDEYDNLFKYRTGIISFEFSKGEESRGYKVTTGSYPYRHKNGKVSFTQGCGAGLEQTSIINKEGFITPITPCLKRYYKSSKISPDESNVAVVIRYLNSDIRFVYSTLIYDIEGNEIARYDAFASIDWLPDGRLLMSSLRDGYGLYITTKDFKNAHRIDKDKLQAYAGNVDVSPSGKQIVFEYSQQIWIMNIDGTDIKKLLRGSKRLKFPTWSPNENYIAYLAENQDDYFDRYLYLYALKTEKYYNLNLEDTIFTSSQTGYPDISGPLSWTP